MFGHLSHAGSIAVLFSIPAACELLLWATCGPSLRGQRSRSNAEFRQKLPFKLSAKKGSELGVRLTLPTLTFTWELASVQASSNILCELGAHLGWARQETIENIR